MASEYAPDVPCPCKPPVFFKNGIAASSGETNLFFTKVALEIIFQLRLLFSIIAAPIDTSTPLLVTHALGVYPTVGCVSPSIFLNTVPPAEGKEIGKSTIGLVVFLLK